MQTPKAILCHVDGSARVADRVHAACQLADRFDAVVTGSYGVMPSLLRFPMAIDGGGGAVAVLAELDEQGREAAQEAFVTAGAGSPRLRWSARTGDALWGFGRDALYCDLMILGQRDAADPAASELPSDFIARLLIESGKPALVLPFAGPIEPIGRKVLVAWKETRESAHAVSAALPWLRRAEQVHLVCHGDDADAELRSLQGYLAAQGVSAVLPSGGPERGDTGEQLLSWAADLGVDLLVMGCYGHSRAREWVLGGATRTILQSMTLPVLMAH